MYMRQMGHSNNLKKKYNDFESHKIMKKLGVKCDGIFQVVNEWFN